MLMHLSFTIIILSLSLLPLSSSAEIYKWTDEKGTVHFAEDPSEIPEEGPSDQQKFIQPAPSLSTRLNKTEEDIRLLGDHKSKELFQGMKNYKEKSGNNLFYFVGLLIIVGILLMLFQEKRPAGIGVKRIPQGSFVQRKRTVLFRVCCKDCSTDSTIVIGKVMERRIRERGDNFRDLLCKARKDFGDRVEDPTDIFLLTS